MGFSGKGSGGATKVSPLILEAAWRFSDGAAATIPDWVVGGRLQDRKSSRREKKGKKRKGERRYFIKKATPPGW